jgi:2Fe-2S ferredoxin
MKVASPLQPNVWIDQSIKHSLVNQLTHWNFNMPKIIILPHHELCPDGDIIEAKSGETICNILLKNNIPIEHACDQVCACTTCHVFIKEGIQSLDPSEETEDDMLDKAWGLSSESRLSCQAIIKNKDLTIEIPKYTINLASEG